MKALGLALVVGASLLAAGCQPTKEQLAMQAQQDDETCKSYGAKPGTESMINCRVALMQQHEAARRQRAAAIDSALDTMILANAMSRPAPVAAPAIRTPIVCNRYGTQTVCN